MNISPRMRLPLSLAALLLCAGCVTRERKVSAPEPFVFRALDLQHQEPNGKPAWQLRSPEARYDTVRQLAQARQPRGTVFRRGKPHITIQAQRGTVIGDGQAIQLEGDVLITLLGKEPVRISGDQARWIPSKELMVIDRRPAALDRRSRLTAQEAHYFLARDLVELRGEPTLEQWEKAGRQRASAAPLRVRTEQVDWRPDQGDLNAPKPVRGVRRQKDSNLTLAASGLRGNLRQGYVDLLAPVQVRDSKRQGWLNAQQTRWAFNDALLSSNLPFEGQMKKLKLRGQAFTVNLEQSDVAVQGDCQLQQPGEQLQAQQCFWNWPSGRFQAQGAVELRRATYKQITRASVLNGQIGKEGTAVFRAPGSKVTSQFTLPRAQKGAPAKRKAAPVVF